MYSHSVYTKTVIFILTLVSLPDKFIQMLFLLQHNTTGFTCREVSLILKKIKDPVNRFEAFENMLGYILDTENRAVKLGRRGDIQTDRPPEFVNFLSSERTTVNALFQTRQTTQEKV